LDRLFLAALVEEIGPRIHGSRVRTAHADRGSGTLVLSFERSRSLVWSFLAEAAGLYLGEPPPSSSTGARATRPGLKKSVTGAVVTGLEILELDRIVVLSLEQTRLSGKTSRSRLVLEVPATRVDLYLVDGEQDGIVEVYSSTRSRLGPGELYRPPPPLPGAAPFAADGDELEKRLAKERRAEGQASRPRRSGLLAATGLTPLLVREMEWLVDFEKRSERDAYEHVRRRLDEKRPVLYVARDPVRARGRIVVASPLPLRGEAELVVAPLPEPTLFSDVMAEAVAVALRTRTIRSGRGRLAAAVSKRLERARRLQQKLLDERASFEEPDTLRRKGETLLAALSRARRSPDGRTVALPDLFDPEEKEIVLEIDPRLPLSGNAERFFSRAKKAARAETELSTRLDAIAQELSFLEAFECDVADAIEPSELAGLAAEAKEEGLVPVVATDDRQKGLKGRRDSAATPRLPPREFLSHRGHAILVGRSARSNEETTFHIAGPGDLWFHAAGAAGAHVVLRVPPGVAADEREIGEAAGLAAHFSKRRNDTAVDVLVTERRHVSKIKGAPRGLVKVSSARTVRVAPRLLSERRRP
jgi:predicted ribosome quality control (RQC) complex YloA/Tae2 family protein